MKRGHLQEILLPAFMEEGGGQRAFPASAVSQVPEAQNNQYDKEYIVGWHVLNPFKIRLSEKHTQILAVGLGINNLCLNKLIFNFNYTVIQQKVIIVFQYLLSLSSCSFAQL